MKQEPSHSTAHIAVSSDNGSYYHGSGECREDDNERVMWYGGPARIGFGRSARGGREGEGLVKVHGKLGFGGKVDRTFESDNEHQDAGFTTQERADSYSPTDEQKEKFRGYLNPRGILRGTAVSREQFLYARDAERERMERLGTARRHSGDSQPQKPRYSTGKEHLSTGSTCSGFRTSSTYGTTSAEKMPMRGGNDAALINVDVIGHVEDDDDEDAEVNLEGLVLRTRVQVPDAMRRAMENDEEWHSFA